MPNDPKIVVIGAGSASFSLVTLKDILMNPDLQKATLYMVDINEGNLKIVKALAKKLKNFYGSTVELISEIDRRKVLANADFVVMSIAVNREKTWKQDYEIAKKFGIWHYAENGGPGSFGHTARNIATIMPILDDIHDLAPNSWLINFTNPLPRIHYAAKDYAKLRCISFCHQLWHGYWILGNILSQNLKNRGKLPQKPGYLDYRDSALEEYEITAAGLNHFTWMIDIRSRSTKENIYPLVRQLAESVDSSFEALTLHVFRIFGYLPVPGDTHLSEYLPYAANKDNWEKYNLYHYNFRAGIRNRENNWLKIKQLIDGRISPDVLEHNPAERIENIIHEIYTDASIYEPALNVQNNGSIPNLPDDAVVEIPCIVNNSGARGKQFSALTEGIAALCRREISIAKLITKSSVEGDREAAIQAFALDPMVNDLDLAEKLVDAYLEAFRDQLPQFFSG